MGVAKQIGLDNSSPDLDALDKESLKALVLAQRSQIKLRDSEIENLKLLIEKLKRMHFGQRSEKLRADIEQLELRLEELEATSAMVAPMIPASLEAAGKQKPARRGLPAALPREVETIAPKQDACPDCGGALRPFGEDVSEVLEYVPASFKVIRTVRPRLSCACCSRVLQVPAPHRPIDKGLAGPGLLAHVLVSKYADHYAVSSAVGDLQPVRQSISTVPRWPVG